LHFKLQKIETWCGLLAKLDLTDYWDLIMRNTENRQLAAMAARRSASRNSSEKPLKQRRLSADASMLQPSLAANDPLFFTGGQRDFT
jgi:hypothetical protein